MCIRDRVGTEQRFYVDYTQRCHPFGPWGTCFQMVFDITGNPNSTVSCGYWYWDTWNWQPAWNEEEIALDKNGYARHSSPTGRRTGTRPSPAPSNNRFINRIDAQYATSHTPTSLHPKDH